MTGEKPSSSNGWPGNGAALYRPGRNCLRSARADKAALLIDCAAYYRALYHALCRARHSVFILGWDIDSRIELLRGREAEGQEFPVRFFDLIEKKARENPELKIYLNRWNYSVFFLRERDPFSGFKWHIRSPANVYFCSDFRTPFTACHHQKVITVDDEIAFCGGMDVALGRWDQRQHHIEMRERTDPGGLLRPVRKKPYEPYHDIQIMMTGPVVPGILSELVRARWKKGAGFEAVPVRRPAMEESGLWPDHVTPDFENAEMAVARTLPETGTSPPVREVLAMYLDEISRAEKFIYIENQYLTCRAIAEALNSRLIEKPDLRVLIVSADHPRGVMEHRVMWTGRVDFCDIAGKGVPPARFTVAYPVSRENGEEKTIHIHSKIMIVDDRFLHIGSANLNNRSMRFDTECDVVIEGQNERDRSRIAAIRNNLIREHTGREERDIEAMVSGRASLDELLQYQTHSRQHLLRIDNGPYRKVLLSPLARKIGDPDRAHILTNIPVRQVLAGILVVTLLAVMIWTWLQPDFSEILSEETVTGSIEKARDSRWSILWVSGIYVVAGAVLFPVTVLNLTTAIVFGPFYGIVMGLAGSLASAAAGFATGRFAGEKMLSLFRPVSEKVRYYAKRGGVTGMTLVRLVPIAPFTLVNLAFGLSGVHFPAYMLATALGLLPGIFAKAMFGGALGQLWENPEPRIAFFAAGSLLLWLFIIWLCQRIVRRYKKEMKL